MKKAENAIPNELLSFERERHYWTQEDVAERLGVPDAKMIGRWERGITLPTLHYRQKLEVLFGKSIQALGFPHKDEIPFWNVPYRQNLYFTGRDSLLSRLHTALATHKPTTLISPQALTGLGGVGKTQLAVEYAYRYRDNYHTVAWVRGESREVLTSDFAALADLLHLPEKDNQDQSSAVAAVKRWLEVMTRWLLIFDNANTLTILHDFLPTPCRGHILLTTNTAITGTLAHSFEVDVMEPEESTHFLLRRSKNVALDASPHEVATSDYQHASQIARTLGYLPLAIDQAGAYIEETACGLSGYLRLYATSREDLLLRRGELVNDHIEPVATTWSLAFEELARTNAVALDLLRLLAFLSPDAIPEEIISQGADEPGSLLASVALDPVLINDAVKDLRKFSLVRRNSKTRLLSIHTLVQLILRDGMTQEQQRFWAERAVRATDRVFPQIDLGSVEWQAGERYLAQAIACVELIKQWDMHFPEAAHLLYRIGNHFQIRGHYTQVEPYYQMALAIREQLLGPEHLAVAEVLNDLGILFFCQGNSIAAETSFERALAIREKLLDAAHPDVAESLFNVGLIRLDQEKYEQAEMLYLRALYIQQNTPEMAQECVAETLGELGFLYLRLEKFDEAERYLQEAWAVCEKVQLQDHPVLAIILNSLAGVYRIQQKYEQAETLLLHVISLWERKRGLEHPDVAYGLCNLAKLYVAQENYVQAQKLYQRALFIFEQALGPESAKAKQVMNWLADVYAQQGDTAQAALLNRRAATMREHVEVL